MYQCRLKLDSGRRFTFYVDGKDKVTAHFTMDETINKSCKGSVKAVFTERSLTFLRLREDFRNDYYAKYKRSMPCTSCYREANYNKLVGGISDSKHLQMLAADLKTGQPVTDEVFEWCKAECEKLMVKYHTVMELGRYNDPDRIHIGMDITYSDKLYTFDKRK